MSKEVRLARSKASKQLYPVIHDLVVEARRRSFSKEEILEAVAAIWDEVTDVDELFEEMHSMAIQQKAALKSITDKIDPEVIVKLASIAVHAKWYLDHPKAGKARDAVLRAEMNALLESPGVQEALKHLDANALVPRY